ncbi:hypothetical protein FNW52_09615 [Flavobacterium sp. ZT3R18]|uniref:DUF6602 domain-containing protein n=1 Tax=Flavobacterium sp. ZT3R18 TaxID=2594429 RepID=UPI001179E37C|nr:DUF6602 domain-containing protein [Flavobacterium sp. ZT3R18]TRX35740.1 hypothetical protein FNW52_09615 [Flavobacterium sp. ZT3R18]
MEPIIFKATDRVSKHYKRRVAQILSRFEDIRELIEHQTSKGTRVEKEIRQFLIDFLPEMYEYSSGIVIDNSGSECDKSKQEDILIIDKFFNPKLFIDEEPSIYPVDVIYCGIEVKTSINETELSTAVKNIESLKKLKFIKDKVTSNISNGFTVSDTNSPIGIIFAFDTTFKSSTTLLNHYNKAIADIALEHRPNLLCILNRGIIGISQNNKPIIEIFGLIGQDKDGNIGEITTKSTDLYYQSGGHNYPKILVNDNYIIVDPSRIMLGFLQYLIDLLLKKVIISKTNLLNHYIPEQMNKRISFELQ